MIAEGIHKAKCVEADLVEVGGEGSGKVQACLIMQNTEGESVKAYLNLFGLDEVKAASNVKRTVLKLRAIGWAGDDLTDLSSVVAAGMETDITVKHTLDNSGNPRIECDIGAHLGMGAILNEASKASFREKMRAIVHSISPVAPAANTNAAAKPKVAI